MKNHYSSIVLTDSLERELLQAELAQQMHSPLDGVFSSAARGVGQLFAKVADLFRFQRQTDAKAA